MEREEEIVPFNMSVTDWIRASHITQREENKNRSFNPLGKYLFSDNCIREVYLQGIGHGKKQLMMRCLDCLSVKEPINVEPEYLQKLLDFKTIRRIEADV